MTSETKIKSKSIKPHISPPVDDLEPVFNISRRSFVQLIGAGILITVTADTATAQRGRSGGRQTIAARVRIDADGTISVMTGKVEEGQGPPTQISMAAAEELRVPLDKINLIMSDTAFVPDDGITAGSRTTPYTIPAVRQGCAAARNLLTQLAADQWKVHPDTLKVNDAKISNPKTNKTLAYSDLAKINDLNKTFAQSIPADIKLTHVKDWRTMGKPTPRPNSTDLVTGAHKYPSDIALDNMLYAKVLRPISYGASLESIDLSKAKAIKDVSVVRDDQFVACAAPTTFLAEKALAELEKKAEWKTTPQVSDKDLFAHLKKNARTGGRSRGRTSGSIEKGLADAKKVVTETYEVSYVQHSPMETRTATAQWKDDKLTVWTGVDYPQRAQGDIARTFGIGTEKVRVIVPDMGGGFGGKHTAEAAIEAARIAKTLNRPIALHWTRAEEFTWAYSRPAALIEAKAGLDADGKLLAWDFTSINPGSSGVNSPYYSPNTRIRPLSTDSPIRQGSYRCLGSSANNFAREAFIDQIAATAGKDPLEFRLENLEDDRIRNILEIAAEKFDWQNRKKKITPEFGVGMACGTDKNSVVAAGVEVEIDRKRGQVKVLYVCEAFECGPIQNPANLTSQVQGCIMMGLGPALFEKLEFSDGRILNPGFGTYRIPRFTDLPKIDVHLVNRTDIPSSGGGETPIIAIAPAIANAVFAATGISINTMPLKPEVLKKG